VLRALGSEHVMVVHSDDGLDEISIAAATSVAELKEGEISEYRIEPGDFGLPIGSLDGLVVEDSAQSLELVQQALEGTNTDATNIVAINAGAAIYLSGRVDSLAEGVELAQEAISGGLASAKLAEFVAFTADLPVPPFA